MSSENIYYWISVPILAEIENISEAKVTKVYKKVIQDECIPLRDIPVCEQEIFVKEYLFRDRYVDYSLLDFVKNFDDISPLYSPEVQFQIRKMDIVRTANMISKSFSATGTSTEQLRKLAQDNNISYSTLARWRKKCMKDKSLSLLSDHVLNQEDIVDRYRTCCYYCRDLITVMKCKPGKISGAKIFRDITAMKPFQCSRCPYNPDVKAGPHEKQDCIPEATCKRKSEYMVVPNNVDVVWTIIKRIPEQQKVMEWEGVRSWANKFHFTPAREKSSVTNECWFSDHKQLDIIVRTKKKKDGTWEIARPWITGIIDCASNVLISYVLSLNPNSDCIAEAFARACAFTVDTPYSGLPQYFYIDNGKDYRSSKMRGLPNSESEPLYLNKDFAESGILSWYGVKVIHALPYRGCSKTIESIWGTIDDEWIRPLPGYCGCSPDQRPYILKQQIKDNELYTFEQFADYFADTIYPEYNNFSVTNPSPDSLYHSLPKADTFVPSWRSLSVLKSKSTERVIRQKGIQYGKDKYYWCSELGPLIEKHESTKYRIFAFDTPFNRNISVVRGHKYIGEAHLIEKLNVVEKRRYLIIQHTKEQEKQRKFYSKRIERVHNIVLQTDILNEACKVPAVDHIRYAQAIDKERDEIEAIDDKKIPEELKVQAVYYADNLLTPDTLPEKNGEISQSMKELGRKLRNR